jgi:transposase
MLAAEMRRHTTFKFCLDPTVEQQQLLARHAGAARFAFNQCLRIVKTALTRPQNRPGYPGAWTGFDLINAQQSASILNVALTSLLGLSVKFPSADPVIVYLPPTPVTSALPTSPQ